MSLSESASRGDYNVYGVDIALEPLENQETPNKSGSNSEHQIKQVYKENVNKPKIRKKYCKYCGNLIDNTTKQCTGCGKQYFKGVPLNKNLFSLVILFIVIIGLSILSIVQYKNITTLKGELDDIETNYTSIENELYEEIMNALQEHTDYWNENHQKVDFMNENIVFVIDGYGNYYYTYDQMEQITQGLSEYSYWAYNKEQAISKGYIAWR